MALFQLDPQSIAARVRASGQPVSLPTLSASVLRGMLGFTIVSVAGFLPWPIIDRWFPAWRETQLYISCTGIFIGLSGICLHRLIIGPGSLSRFYKLFSLSFVAYAAGWIALWVALRDQAGSIGGGLAGTAAMGAILSLAFAAPRTMPQVIAALFVLNTLGYGAGEWIAGKFLVDQRLLGVILWALCYGLGFGAGLGAAFHFCQAQARELLRDGGDSTAPLDPRPRT